MSSDPRQSPPAGVPRPWETLVIVGLGLIGGSAAMAARRAGLARRIVAAGRSRASMEEPLAKGLVDEITTDLAPAAASPGALILLARPVEVILSDLEVVCAAAQPDAIITDAGSTKGRLVERAEALSRPGGPAFVGSHPMAGSDKTGWRHGRADLFDGACAFVTATERTDPAAAARVAEFWRACGSRVIFCSPTRHDRLVAAVSHTPHLAAVALVEELAASGEDPALLRLISGPGLRDTTRVAKGDPDLWQQICLQNPEALADSLAGAASRLEALAEAIRRGDAGALREALARAREFRCLLDRDNGPTGE